MGVAAEGDDLSAVFRQAALGIRQILTDSNDILPVQELRVEVKGDDYEELLVNWLSELVYLLEAQQFLLADCRIEKLEEKGLRALVSGEPYDAKRHQLQREIKAVTYHQIRVEKLVSGWRAQVFVDL